MLGWPFGRFGSDAPAFGSAFIRSTECPELYVERIEASCVSMSPGSAACTSGLINGGNVVWLCGEHDVSTAAVVSAALRQAMSLDDGDVVADLRGVRFMDASIIGVFVRADGVLAAQSRMLRLRSPSRCARRIVELCGLERLLQTDPAVGRAFGPGGALATWVAIPASLSVDQSSRPANSDSQGSSSAGGVVCEGLLLAADAATIRSS